MSQDSAEYQNHDSESSPSFAVNQKYSDSYLQDRYNPEEYQQEQIINDAITTAFTSFIKAYPEYSYLRSVDINRIKVGDVVNILNYDKPANIKRFKPKSNTVICVLNGEEIEVPVSDLRTVDAFLTRLKAVDIQLLYTYIRSKVSKEIFGDIEYFSIFSEYFRINETTLYQALPVDIKQILLTELNERTGVFKSKGVRPLY